MTQALIAFYSRTGTTRELAQMLGRMTRGRIHEIVDHKNRQGFAGNLGGGLDAVFRRGTRISPLSFDPGGHGPVLLGCPVWLGHIPPALTTFIRQYHNRFTGRVGLFCTFSGGGEAHACGQAQALLGSDIPCLFIGAGLSLNETEKKAEGFVAELLT